MSTRVCPCLSALYFPARWQANDRIATKLAHDGPHCKPASRVCSRSRSRSAFTFPSFQLGTITLARGKSCLSRVCSRYFKQIDVICSCFVTALRRVTSGFLVGFENQTSLPLLASYKGGLLYVLTVYPAESWAPCVRAHEFTA